MWQIWCFYHKSHNSVIFSTNLLDWGRGIFCNILIEGPANTGKTFLLNPFNTVYSPSLIPPHPLSPGSVQTRQRSWSPNCPQNLRRKIIVASEGNYSNECSSCKNMMNEGRQLRNTVKTKREKFKKREALRAAQLKLKGMFSIQTNDYGSSCISCHFKIWCGMQWLFPLEPPSPQCEMTGGEVFHFSPQLVCNFCGCFYLSVFMGVFWCSFCIFVSGSPWGAQIFARNPNIFIFFVTIVVAV